MSNNVEEDILLGLDAFDEEQKRKRIRAIDVIHQLDKALGFIRKEDPPDVLINFYTNFYSEMANEQ